MRLVKHASVMAATAVAAIICLAAPASASATTGAATAGTWGLAQRVTPGEGIDSVSCTPGGYCAATGLYNTSRGTFRYVQTEAHGRWGKVKVFDLRLSFAAFGTNLAGLVSCPSAGNCVVIGAGEGAPFAVNERDGVWGKPHSIGGVTNQGAAQFYALGCTSAGNCMAGGQYMSQGPDGPLIEWQPMVVSEKRGVWGAAEDLPGTSAASDVDGNVTSISCTGRTCLADGFYSVGDNYAAETYQFVAFARNDAWGNAELVPGLPSDGSAGPVSCSPDGTCTVQASLSSGQKETLSETNGTWNTTPNVIPGAIALNGNITSLSCASAGDCGAIGQARTFPFPPFVLTEHNGTWGKAEPVPGLLALSHGKSFKAAITGVSCGAPGNCAATGWANVYVTAAKVRTEAFVISQVAGRWHWAHVVPGIVKLDRQGNSQGAAVACWSADHCAASGSFEIQGSTSPHAFVVTER